MSCLNDLDCFFIAALFGDFLSKGPLAARIGFSGWLDLEFIGAPIRRLALRLTTNPLCAASLMP